MDLFEFYNIDILSVYQNNPDVYEVYTDNFEGKVLIREDYYENLLPEEMINIYIHIQFGFRTKKDGELALAVLSTDLRKAPDVEQKKWQGFRINDESIFKKEDDRFKLFYDRYIMGNWDIENGVLTKIKSLVSEINALTEMTLDVSMFKIEKDLYLTFPSAENDHKYQDAHTRVYGFLIDGLQMSAIKKLAIKTNIELEKDIKKTLKALKKILPEELQNEIIKPLRKVSKKRGPATHNTRKPAKNFPSFSQFNSDMENIFKSLELIKEFIEKTTNISAEVCMERKNKLEMLPKFDVEREKEIKSNYSIYKFNNIVEKTIEKVEIGFKKRGKNQPENELSFLYFNDGSTLSISIVSNIKQLINSDEQNIINNLSLKFHLDFVPPLKKR